LVFCRLEPLEFRDAFALEEPLAGPGVNRFRGEPLLHGQPLRHQFLEERVYPQLGINFRCHFLEATRPGHSPQSRARTGFRVENSPFGGIKDSGLGIKEGVIEAMKGYSYVKTFSLPW
jgi:hypothetical protein